MRVQEKNVEDTKKWRSKYNSFIDYFQNFEIKIHRDVANLIGISTIEEIIFSNFYIKRF